MIGAAIPPEEIAWLGETPDLLAANDPLPRAGRPIRVPRGFAETAETAAMHADPNRFGLLYRLLWRLQERRDLMEDPADADVARALALAKAVRRDIHKMHAFVRFKEIADESGASSIAWFEPQHYIERAAADFFVKRFANMRWSIVTPRVSAHWDGAMLRFGPGGARADVPAEDARDEDWRIYYANMFNPSRLKIAAMTREMPRHYWRNLPEATEIESLIRQAPARDQHMISAPPSAPRKRAGVAAARIAPQPLSPELAAVSAHGAPPATLAELREALAGCRACPLWRDATQAVPGEGPEAEPLLALVGEQPGDQEDLRGRPFVGPAGQVLDRALAAAGIERAELFVTNAVKHFKNEPRGKRRLHKKPNRDETEACRWWVRHELALVRPRLVVALGVTALQSLSGADLTLTAARGRDLETREGMKLRATIHPSALLRMPDEDIRAAEFDRFVSDLAAAAASARA